MSAITLTADQQRGMSTILQSLDDPDAKTMVVKGYAGTGKSTLIQHVIKALGGAFKVAFTAPTNKATKVLRMMAAEADVSVDDVLTIYRLLGLRLAADGEVKALRSTERGPSLAEYDIVVVDEGSMVNSVLYQAIAQELTHANTKVIFMGDPLQLPPVGEDMAACFTGHKYSVELTEVVRQARENPIIQLTADLRESIEAGRWTFSFQSTKAPNGHGVYVLDRPKWEQWMRAGFAGPAYQKDGDAFRAVAWRNKTVDYLNRRIRQAVYKEQASERFLVGEHVLTAAPIMDEFGDAVLVSTDSEGVIRDIDVVNHPYLEYSKLGSYKVYQLSIWFDDVGLVEAYVSHEDSERAVDQRLQQLSSEAKKDRKLWGTFWTFKEAFNDIRPAHAITAHRSQGSTYGNVFVDVNDIMVNHNWTEAMKCLYVACSRASQNLMVVL